ncbi:MAG: LCP family protein [Candidatus Nomurabacteria bacterium]|jgi:LCP family protein required for cell wall assembly|nr:LCP family protein [Candidatus Nomurabacteria bacterium]
MERKSNKSIDGFVPRRNGKTPVKKDLGAPTLTPRQPVGLKEKKTSRVDAEALALKKEIDDSLENLSDDFTDLEPEEKMTRKEKRQEKLQKKLTKRNKKRARKGKSPLTMQQFKKRRIIKRIVWFVVVVALALFGWQAWRLLSSMGNLFDGSIFEIVQKARLKEDENGRTNVLIFGTEPDDWDGADLTDSVMVVSIDQDDYSAYTVSLPRDLYVKHTCKYFLGTTAGKLNESYVCGREDHASNSDKGEAAGIKELADTVTEITGLDVHYSAHVNWQVVVQTVDSIGGIDLTIEVYDGSPEMYDYYTNVRYKNGEKVHLDGQDALALSRARGAGGGYGLSGGNFDRERNQQKIIQAVIAKMQSTGQFNPLTVIDMVDALGDNIHTDFHTSEIRTLADIGQGFDPSRMVSIPLVDHDNDVELLQTDTINGISVVVPSAGLYKYDDIKKYIKLQISAEGWEREMALIDVFNGSGVVGVAAVKADGLEKEGFTIGNIANAPEGTWPAVTIYKFNDDSPETEKKLSEKYDVTVVVAPSTITTLDKASFAIIFGQ